ncbi:oligosaccharide flippase family protein [Candidatus Gottesmanbacteria bacterium]|nr:oligosaccharide flippase family protein [Candidatus Gottesmanbacteria bacterium]
MGLFRRIVNSQMARGSAIIFIGSNIGNFINLIFNFSMGRLLGPEKYGELGALFSSSVLLGVILGILSLFTVKVVSSYWGKKDFEKILEFHNYLTPRLFLLSFLVCMILLAITPLISRFLHLVSFTPFILVALSFILSGPATLNKGILQGVLAFSYVTVNGVVEVTLKLIISVILVILNFGLLGPVLGSLLGGIAGYILTVVQLKIIFRRVTHKKNSFVSWEMLKSFIPVTLASLTLALFLNMDIILVRHFLSGNIAGEYVALSTISKIIFYGIGPVITVMFPLISTRVSNGLPYLIPLLGTLVMSLGLSAVIMFTFFLFPKLIINSFFGGNYLSIIPYLGLFSFYITIFSLNSILTYFLLSISYYRPIFSLFIISLMQGVFIFMFHDNIWQVIWVNIAVSILYFMVISFFVLKKEGSIIYNYLLKKLSGQIYAG